MKLLKKASTLIIGIFLMSSTLFALNLKGFYSKKYDHFASLIKQNKLEEFKKALGKNSVNKYRKSNSNLLLVSVMHNRLNFVEFLINKGANIEEKVSKYNSTIIHEAIRKGNIKISTLLIKKSTNLNIQDKNGQTVLHVSSKLSYDNIIGLLLKKGIDKSIKDINGQTAYDIAKNNFEINRNTLKQLKVKNSIINNKKKDKKINKYNKKKTMKIEDAINAKKVDVSFTHMETENHNEKNIRHSDNDAIKIGK